MSQERPFEKCKIHPDSTIPCKPTPGFNTYNEDCPRAFAQDLVDNRELWFDVALAGYIELVLEGRPRQAVKHLDDYIKRHEIDWANHELNPKDIDHQVRPFCCSSAASSNVCTAD